MKPLILEQRSLPATIEDLLSHNNEQTCTLQQEVILLYFGVSNITTLVQRYIKEMKLQYGGTTKSQDSYMVHSKKIKVSPNIFN